MDLYHELPLDQILRGDCIELMRMLPTASVDCVFADPHAICNYAANCAGRIDSLVDGVDEEWDRFSDFASYDAFTRSLADGMPPPAAQGWHAVGDRRLSQHLSAIGAILQDLGFWILNDVIWRKSNPMPNFRGRRFTNAHETLIWAARGRRSRYRFKLPGHEVAVNDDIQMRSDWFIPLCTGQERLQNEHGLKLHPTQKPEALLHRVLLASTNQDDIILDPFTGTGTTPQPSPSGYAAALDRYRAPSRLYASPARRAACSSPRLRAAPACCSRTMPRPRSAGFAAPSRSRWRAPRRSHQAGGAAHPVRQPRGARLDHTWDHCLRSSAPGQRNGRGPDSSLSAGDIRGFPSTRLARCCRTHQVATAGPSGTSNVTARWCRWTCYDRW